MIKLIIGGIGSGKTLSAVKEIAHRPNKVYISFPVKLKNTIRLKTDHIITTEILGYNQKGEAKKQLKVNWDYWNKHKSDGFDIMIDEVHNLLHSRRSMSKWNTLFSMWLAQIRKMLGDSEKNHLYLISQKAERIDVSARDLAQEIIYVSKQQSKELIKTKIYDSRAKRYKTKLLPKTYIIKTVFTGTYCLEKFYSYLNGEDSEDYQTMFLGNKYFQYYDSYALTNFGEDVYL